MSRISQLRDPATGNILSPKTSIAAIVNVDGTTIEGTLDYESMAPGIGDLADIQNVVANTFDGETPAMITSAIETIIMDQINNMTKDVQPPGVKTYQIANNTVVSVGDVVDIINDQIGKTSTGRILSSRQLLVPAVMTSYTQGFCVTRLSDTKVVFLYAITGTCSYLVVANIEGSVITIGTPISVNMNPDAPLCTITALNETQVVAGFKSTESGSTYSKQALFTVDGLTISTTTWYWDTTTAAWHTYNSCAINSTQALLNRTCSASSYSYILNLSGSTLSLLSGICYVSSAVYNQNLVKMSDSVFLIFYTTSTNLKVAVIVKSGDTLTCSSTTQLATLGSTVTSTYVGAISAKKLNDTTVFVTYANSSNYGTSMLVSLSGTTISYTASVAFTTTTALYFNCSYVNANQIFIEYVDTSTNVTKGIMANINNNIITYEPVFVIDSARRGLSSSCFLQSQNILLYFLGDVTAGNLAAYIYTMSVNGIFNISTNAIAMESGVGGDTIKIVFDGNVKIPNITKGAAINATQTNSLIPVDAVSAYSPLDEIVSVKGYWK